MTPQDLQHEYDELLNLIKQIPATSEYRLTFMKRLLHVKRQLTEQKTTYM